MNNKPITVVHVISSLSVGGAERSLANLVLGMDGNQFNNIVVSLQDLGYWGPILQSQGIAVFALNMRPMNIGYKIYKLWQILRTYKPDYLQGWMYHANVLALIVGKLAGIKNIYWNIRCSLMDLSRYKLTTRFIFQAGKIFAKYPAVIINNSRQSIEQHCEQGYKVATWRYIPNGFDTQIFQPNPNIYTTFRIEHNLPRDAIVIGLIARFDPMKDHATFIQAASILAKRLDNVYFVCAGRYINEDNTFLRDVISEHNIQGRMILLDQVDNMHLLYPALNYLTQTSIFGEGFPNVVAEAMACGVVCFVTNVGEATQIIGEHGYVIQKQNPEELANRWYEAISAKEQIHKTHVRQRIVANYSIQNAVASYCELYGIAP